MLNRKMVKNAAIGKKIRRNKEKGIDFLKPAREKLSCINIPKEKIATGPAVLPSKSRESIKKLLLNLKIEKIMPMIIERIRGFRNIFFK